ncbi:T9SS type A sorting domain-containing protein [Segetibacter aerophilus]|uniref:Secretion system C-terminal sorting domain-containing protein n=1 Tax=Segetibacter aerophilus TaxID=670293 RepID=A0A512BD53_9BACT|nr:T9SS type A sorting domain-containing protein [Segetibacter aerophilus]GEO09892.1 hypothetical protein SAE01_23880 [Segetibacter aerophilus]
MKSIYFLLLLGFSFQASAQVVTADPAVGALNLTDNITKLDRSRTISSLPVTLTVPVLNLSPYNSIPNNSTTIIIGLGSRLSLSPSFNLATARLSNYFSFVYNTSASQPRIIGTQIAAIPKDFIDSTSFEVVGKSSGSSAASVNFSINATANVDDEDGSNNAGSISYTVLITLPVTLSQFNALKTGCNIDVSFNSEEEKNASSYDIEVSKDGNSFVSIGEIPAANAGKYARSFPITESMKAPSLYVRVKSIDKDSRFVYSAVRKVAGNCDAPKTFGLSLFPNPVTVTKEITIVATEGLFAGKYDVSLIDMNGRTLQTRQLQLNNTSNFQFNLGNISSGHYLIKVINTAGGKSSAIHFQKN